MNDTPDVNSEEFAAPFCRVAWGGTELQKQFVLPIGMTIRNLFVEQGGQQAVEDMNIMTRLEGADTTLELTILAGAGVGFVSNTTDSFHANAGDNIGWNAFVATGGTSAAIRSIAMLGYLDG